MLIVLGVFRFSGNVRIVAAKARASHHDAGAASAVSKPKDWPK
jgi:hypothetical protein